MILQISKGHGIYTLFIDINWFFWGLEKVKLTVTRNLIIKLITLLGIFIFVKTRKDILIYAFILVIGTILSDVCGASGKCKERA